MSKRVYKEAPFRTTNNVCCENAWRAPVRMTRYSLPEGSRLCVHTAVQMQEYACLRAKRCVFVVCVCVCVCFLCVCVPQGFWRKLKQDFFDTKEKKDNERQANSKWRKLKQLVRQGKVKPLVRQGRAILRTPSQYSSAPNLPLIYYLLCHTDTRPRVLRRASQYSFRDPGEHE